MSLPPTSILTFLSTLAADLLLDPTYTATIGDTSSNIVAQLPLLQLDLPHIASVTSTDGVVTVGVSALAANQGVLDQVTGGFAVADTVSALVASLGLLSSDNNIVSVTGTDGQVNVNVAAFRANQAGLDKVTGGFLVADTAANISANLDTLASDPLLLSITITDNAAVGVTVDRVSSDATAIGKLHNADATPYRLAVADTAYAIQTGLPALEGQAAHISSITPTSGVVTVSAATFAADETLLDTIAGGFNISDTAAAVKSALPLLASDSHVGSITATDGPVSVTTATFAADKAALDKIVGGFAISDTAAAVQAALPALANDNNLSTITATGGLVSVAVASFAADKAALDKIVGGFAINDTAAAVKAALPVLANDNNLATITATGGVVTVTAAMEAADKVALDKIVGGFAVSDTAAAVEAALPALAMDSKITSITATDGKVVVAASAVQADQAALDKIVGGYSVSGFGVGQTLDEATLAYKPTYQAVFHPDSGVLQIIDTAAGNAVVDQRSFTGSFDGSLFTLGSDGAAGTLIGLRSYAAAEYRPGDLAFSAVTGASYIAYDQHYPGGQIAGVTYDYLTSTGQPFTGYISATDGIEQFSVDGSQGVQALVGLGQVNAVTTQNAAGSGDLVVDLKDGAIARGNQLDATLQNVQILQLGSGATTVLGFASEAALIYGGQGPLSFYGQGGNDYIQGSSAANAIVGGSGNEVFFGNGGTDVMRGGSGANFMQGGAAAGSSDTFYGTGGADYVYGRGGTTTLNGSSGAEFMSGGSGLNTLVGSTASQGLAVLAGTTGTDVFYAGIGVNLMYEGSGSSTFHGGSGIDAIAGGSGQSTILGGSGTLFVNAGSGNQHVVASTGRTVFTETAAHMTAGRLDVIDRFQGGDASGGDGTSINLAASVAGATSFTSQNGGTAITTAVAGGQSEIFVSNASVAAVQAQTHFVV